MAKKQICCPKCGSMNITVDGVNPNVRRGIVSLGTNHGAKLARVLSGKKENASCADCKHVWIQK